jgi:hypothetical protein
MLVFASRTVRTVQTRRYLLHCPEKTLLAFADRGVVRGDTIEEEVEGGPPRARLPG